MSIEFVSKMDIELISYNGSDAQIARAARVSTGRDLSGTVDKESNEKLIRYLMKNKHGSPFEHGSMTFRVDAPIFMWREHMRHRIGFSYNEESGRYKEFKPRFYLPKYSRTQTGKPGHYQIEPGDTSQDVKMMNAFEASCAVAWRQYQFMLDAGIAREVARMVLPVNTMSAAYVTCNPRSLMNFCELRCAPNAQLEIREVACRYMDIFASIFPMTHAAFSEPTFEGGAGMVAP